MTNHPRRRRPPRTGPWRPLPGASGVYVAPSGTPPPTGYRHAEAFCLMTYQADDGSETEVIWNSRDGVTPFVIHLKSGKEASHVFALARRAVDYTPPPGSRIFVDLTPERARELAGRNVAAWWAENLFNCHARWHTPEAMATELAAAYLTPGAPDLIEVAVPVGAGDRYPGRDA